jgi:hypothetical protein
VAGLIDEKAPAAWTLHRIAHHLTTVSLALATMAAMAHANVTAALRWRISPRWSRRLDFLAQMNLVADDFSESANEPCLRHSENAIQRHDVRRGMRVSRSASHCPQLETGLAIANQLILFTSPL